MVRAHYRPVLNLKGAKIAMDYTSLWNKVEIYVIQYGMNFLIAALIFVIGDWVAKAVGNVVESSIKKSNSNVTLAKFMRNLAYCGIMAFVVIAALNKLGVATNSFIAVIGACGLAVGLALQGSLSIFAAGVMIVIFKPFEVGDQVDAGGAQGVVREIQIFNTILDTPDKKKIIFPNSKVTADKIIVDYSKK